MLTHYITTQRLSVRSMAALLTSSCATSSMRFAAITHNHRAYIRPTQSPLHESKKRYRETSQQSVVAGDAVNPLTKPSSVDKGALHLVSVPIGNLKDFSLRALEVLRQVDYIVCINRQATRHLLELVDVDCSGKLIHYRSGGNSKLIEMLKGGRSMALVAPSGTPCIGDGGGDLVREMLAGGVRVTSVPGPSAVTSALSVSGAMRTTEGPFHFGGTLPEKSGSRLRQLQQASSLGCPCVFYEYPRRLLFVLKDIYRVMPKRVVSVVHEVTKVHESLHRDTAEKLLVYYSRSEMLRLISRGQIVLVIDGVEGMDEVLDGETMTTREELYHRLVRRELDAAGGDPWAASKLVALSLNLPHSAVLSGYQRHEDDLEKAAKTPTASADAVDQRASKSSRRERLKKLRIRRRERLIRKIEQKQELIRLSMTAPTFHK
jgi:16S rRNA (cytidine1402-2'-O)-methyltransferase